MLRVDMVSTGEVGCLSDAAEETLLNSMLSVGYKIPAKMGLISGGPIQSEHYKSMNVSYLKTVWEKAHIRAAQPATLAEIHDFERKYSVKLPKDMFDYFELVNGMMDGESDNELFAFYSLDKLETVVDKFSDWHGIPKYSDALTTLDKPETFFLFSDYFIHLESFAIRLDELSILNNHVYAICGGIYQVVATSFSEFIDLYLRDSDALII